MSDPYRLTVVRPVCAECKHRRDAKVQDKDEPWRDWLCMANEYEYAPEEYNPITGETYPAKRTWRRCREVNANGDCAKFAQWTVADMELYLWTCQEPPCSPTPSVPPTPKVPPARPPKQTEARETDGLLARFKRWWRGER